jgi:hypothetical protein
VTSHYFGIFNGKTHSAVSDEHVSTISDGNQDDWGLRDEVELSMTQVRATRAAGYRSVVPEDRRDYS